MSGIQFTTFGTVPKVSTLVIDKDLDLRPYMLKAASVRAPLDDSNWPVCAIPGLEEVAPSTVILEAEFKWYETTDGTTYTIPLDDLNRPRKIRIDVGPGTALRYVTGLNLTYPDGTIERIDYRSQVTREFIGLPGQTLEIHPAVNSYGVPGAGHYGYVKIVDTGIVYKTSIDLGGIWLSLNDNDIGDIPPSNISITLQGITMPLSDYAKYFPLSPSGLNVDFTGAASRGKMPVFARYL